MLLIVVIVPPPTNEEISNDTAVLLIVQRQVWYIRIWYIIRTWYHTYRVHNTEYVPGIIKCGTYVSGT